jgi:hypothetical protein
MPLRKHTPVPETAMEVVSPVNSICEILREIYHAAKRLENHGRLTGGQVLAPREIMLKSRIAVSMAKSMSRRIGELKGNPQWFGPADEDFWDKKEDGK